MQISNWSKGVGLSLLLHFGVFGYLLWQKAIEPTPLTATAVIVEFSDPPQSIMSVQDLPIGPPQVAAEETTVATEKEQVEPPKEDLPTLEQEPPPDVKPEIVVKKAKPKEKPKEKPKPKEIVKKEKPKEPVQKVVKNAPLVKKKLDKPVEKIAERESPAAAQANTAPPKGNSNKIAAEFNSSGNSQAAEAQWKALVKARLERSLRYPEQALSKRWKGRPVIQMVINSSGEILDVNVQTSSGKGDFDREAVSNAKRNSPLPKPPAELFNSSSTLTVSVPINFDYDKFK